MQSHSSSSSNFSLLLHPIDTHTDRLFYLLFLQISCLFFITIVSTSSSSVLCVASPPTLILLYSKIVSSQNAVSFLTLSLSSSLFVNECKLIYSDFCLSFLSPCLRFLIDYRLFVFLITYASLARRVKLSIQQQRNRYMYLVPSR